MLRRAMNASMRPVASLSDESSVLLDRRIVVKLLVTFFEKGQSQEVLWLMARILAFTGQSHNKQHGKHMLWSTAACCAGRE